LSPTNNVTVTLTSTATLPPTNPTSLSPSSTPSQ
jgi:hypothetical protein